MLSFKSFTLVQENKDTITSFVGGCRDHLQLQNEPQINLLDELEDGMTTGSFNPNTKEIKDVRWFSKKEALDTIGYNNAKEIFNKGLEKLNI